MASNLNLQSAARYIHATAPAKLNGLYEAVRAKCKELSLTPWRAVAAVASKDTEGSTDNPRGILHFVAGCTKESIDQSAGSDQHKASAKARERQLRQLYATLQARFAQSGYTPPADEAEATAAAEKKKFDDAVNAEVEKRLAAKPAATPTK